MTTRLFAGRLHVPPMLRKDLIDTIFPMAESSADALHWGSSIALAFG
jgi:hypothetical protein